jgi:hypothetical protein
VKAGSKILSDFVRNYNVIASTGQASKHAPQSMQVSASTTALSSSILSASTGHVSMQAPHPMQVSLLILTAITSSNIIWVQNYEVNLILQVFFIVNF